MRIPEVRFAESGDVHIAYQRFGSGPDVVVIPPLASNVELNWEQELFRRALEHNARYVRVLDFDKRGIGSSDRFDHHPTLAEQGPDRLVQAPSAEACGRERRTALAPPPDETCGSGFAGAGRAC